jgi:hypothetical protein
LTIVEFHGDRFIRLAFVAPVNEAIPQRSHGITGGFETGVAANRYVLAADRWSNISHGAARYFW